MKDSRKIHALTIFRMKWKLVFNISDFPEMPIKYPRRLEQMFFYSSYRHQQMSQSQWRDTFHDDVMPRRRAAFLVFWVEKSRRRSLSVDPFNRQKSSRYSSLVAVGLWLSFIGLNWTSFSWYAARINSLALSSCLALKHLCKYRVCLKYLDLSLLALRVDFRSFECSRYQFVHRTNKRSWTLRNRKRSITFRTCPSVRFCFFVAVAAAAAIVRQPYLNNRIIFRQPRFSRGVFSLRKWE